MHFLYRVTYVIFVNLFFNYLILKIFNFFFIYTFENFILSIRY